MKRVSIILCVFFSLTLFITPAFAHSGQTDSNGGHNDRSTGEYHYHHGYPAHYHDGGICPYDFDDQTNHSSSGSSGSSHHINGSSSESTDPNIPLNDIPQQSKSNPKNVFWKSMLIFAIGFIAFFIPLLLFSKFIKFDYSKPFSPNHKVLYIITITASISISAISIYFLITTLV